MYNGPGHILLMAAKQEGFFSPGAPIHTIFSFFPSINHLAKICIEHKKFFMTELIFKSTKVKKGVSYCHPVLQRR